MQARTTRCHLRPTPILNGYTLPSRPRTKWESSKVARLVVLSFVVKQVRLKTRDEGRRVLARITELGGRLKRK